MASGQLHAVIRRLRSIVGTQETGGLTDAQLLDRFITARDEAAFEVLLWRHGPVVLNLCRRLLHREQDAEDAFQATFLILVRKANSIGKRCSVGSWLYKVAYRVAREARVQAAKRAVHEKQIGDLPAPEATDNLVWRDLRPVLDEEVSRLPEKYRAASVLCFLEGKTREEAAQELGCPKGTISSRLAWARERLRIRLARRGLALAAGMLSADAVVAAVPTRLVAVTIRGMKDAMTGTLSTQAAALAEGVLRAMFLTKLKVGAILLLAASALAMGTGLAAHQTLMAKSSAARGEEAPRPAARDSGQPKRAEEKPPRTDRHGDPLPEGAVGRLGTTRFRHASHVTSIAFTPGEKELISASSDKTLGLWDTSSGKLLRRFRGHNDRIATAVLSPNGKLIASASYDKTVRLWDRATGNELRQFLGHSARVCDVAFSAAGESLFTVGKDKTIRKWETSTGAEVGQWLVKEANIEQAAFSSDGKFLALSLSDNTIRLWDMEGGRERHRFAEGWGYLSPLAFSADGLLLASIASDKTIRLWRIDTGQEEARVPLGTGAEVVYWSLSVSPDGKYLAAGDNVYCNSSIRLFEIETRKAVRIFRGHCGGIQSLRFTADGKLLASGGSDSTIRLWDVATGKELTPENGHGGALRNVALSPAGKLLASAGFDKTVRVWDAASGKELRKLVGHESLIWPLAFSADGWALMSGSRDNTIRFWDPATGKELRPPLAEPPGASSIASIAPDGKTLVTSTGGAVIWYWDVVSGKELRTVTLNARRLCQLAHTPRGKALGIAVDDSSAADLVVSLWEVDTGKQLGQLLGKPRQGYVPQARLAVSPNGRLAAVFGTGASAVRLIELPSGKEWVECGDHPVEVNALAFAPDGRVLATSCWDGIIRLWDVCSGKQLGSLAGEQGHVYGLVFSLDGKTLFSGGDDTTILIWDVTALTRRESARTPPLTARELEGLWEDLGSADTQKARRALQALAAAPEQAPRFLRERPRPVETVDPKIVAQYIADLDADRFAVREKATQELEKLGSRIEPALRKALASQPSPEAARRLKALLEKVSDPLASPENLRWARALEVLEVIDTAEARSVLETFANGALGAHVTEEAKASLERLARRPAFRP